MRSRKLSDATKQKLRERAKQSWARGRTRRTRQQIIADKQRDPWAESRKKQARKKLAGRARPGDVTAMVDGKWLVVRKEDLGKHLEQMAGRWPRRRYYGDDE